MYEYKITKVLKVVDGDTVDVILDLGFDMFKKERVRLAGIDTPESRTKDSEEKELGHRRKRIFRTPYDGGEELWVRTEKDGKYGRMLGQIVCYNVHQ